MPKLIRVVYAYAQNRYEVIQVRETTSVNDIHKVIADFENTPEKSRRNWKIKIKAGSFNIKRISNSRDAIHATEIAIKNGLVYEEKPTVLKRYKAKLNSKKNTSRSFQSVGGNVKSNPRENNGDYLNHLFRRVKDVTEKNFPKNRRP